MPKLRLLESTLPPINRLPEDIFVTIPRFFTQDRRRLESRFHMNGPLIKMTHVCRSWRNVLLSTPSLWAQVDFSYGKPDQAKMFLGRSGDQLLEVHQHLDNEADVEPFLHSTLDNIHRLQLLEIISYHPHLDHVLESFATSAPELDYLEITNAIKNDIKLPQIFGGRLPKITVLSLNCLDTNLRDLNFPSLTRFIFSRIAMISVRDIASFLKRCPLLEFLRISLPFTPEPPIPPPEHRVRLAALKTLKFDQTTSTCGLLDHLILPNCVEMALGGPFTDERFNWDGEPSAQIHPSSIDHLPITKEITKVVAMPNSCILSGPNGNLRLWCPGVARVFFDEQYLTSLSPISVLDIRELWIGQSTLDICKPWVQTVANARGAFGMLERVEDLTIVSCKTGPLFVALGTPAGDGILLPGLRRLTIYVGLGNVNLPKLVRCAKVRKEYSQPFGKVTVVFEEEPRLDSIRWLELLRASVGELIHRVGVTPGLYWETTDRVLWR